MCFFETFLIQNPHHIRHLSHSHPFRNGHRSVVRPDEREQPEKREDRGEGRLEVGVVMVIVIVFVMSKQ